MSASEENDSIQIDFNAQRRKDDSDDSIEIGAVSEKRAESSSEKSPTLNGTEFFAALLSDMPVKPVSEKDLFTSCGLFDDDENLKSALEAAPPSEARGADSAGKETEAGSQNIVKVKSDAEHDGLDDDEDTGVFHAIEINSVESQNVMNEAKAGDATKAQDQKIESEENQPIKRERKASVQIIGSLTGPTVKLAPEEAEQLKPASESELSNTKESVKDAPVVTEQRGLHASTVKLTAEEAEQLKPASESELSNTKESVKDAPAVTEQRGLHASTVKLAPEEAVQIKPVSQPVENVQSPPIEERKTILRCPATPSTPGVLLDEDIPDLSDMLDISDAPDLSDAPVRPQSEFERTIVFEKSENRWDAADYKLPEIGDKVGGNYAIIDELGRGGFGAVYRAKNLTLGREEALKLILPSAKSEVGDIDKRFEREIDIVSRLEHPNIVRLYSTGVLGHGVLWMTMELVRGSRLDERLKLYGAMKFDKAKNLMLQLLSGLMEAHRRQIVHRDLKPANIILSKKEGYADQVVILDFGLSKALGASEDQTLQNVTVVDSRRVYGTPQYISPEQLTTGKLGPWTDVYAAGLIFYELLTGMPAVDGESLFDIAYKQSYEPLVFPDNLRDTVIEAIINKACAKNPADRYKHAGEFFDALQRVEDISDPLSVLRDTSRGGQNLASIGMLEKTRDDASDMKTQIGLTAISNDDDLDIPIHHTEQTTHHHSFGLMMMLVVTSCLSVFFVLMLIAWYFKLIDVTLSF